MEIIKENPNKSVHFVSLGCSKNLVDSEVMLGYLNLDGYKVVPAPEEANIIVVNTCSFIGPAKEESVNAVLEMADYKNKDQGMADLLIVTGCLAQRYCEELEKEFPEVDMFVGTGQYHKITEYIKNFYNKKLETKSFVDNPQFIHTEMDPRINTAPGYMAWLKVSEGCDRKCTFCIIPTLRGKLRSRSVESLVAETKRLAGQGVKEINLISQDLSNYGKDLDDKNTLFNLLTELEKVEGIEWVRLFYYYPDDLTEDVMDLMSKSSKVCAYLDMPVQHFSDKVLKRMNRFITGDIILSKIKKLREKIPHIVIRTSLIVGFPGETDEDFEKLLEGIKIANFDHLGVFAYSDEEGTPAFHLKEKVPEEVIAERQEIAYELQKEIRHDQNQKYVGQVLKVLVEGRHEETDLLLQGRFYGQAPDIDGKVIINDGEAKSGDFVNVKITEVHEYDLVGEIVND